MKVDFSYYLSIFWRRFHYFVVISLICLVLGVTAAVILPPQYQADATLVVQQPQIPTRLAASTVSNDASSQLQVIQQQLMTRANLIDIANRLKVFSDKPDMSADQIVDAMRARTSLTTTRSRDKNASVLVTVSFTDSNPQRVAAVVNEFVTLILQENVRMRTGMAEDTMEFFKSEVSRLSSALDAQSAKILQYKKDHIGSLPENQNNLQNRENDIVNQMTQNSQKISALTTQKNDAVTLFNNTGTVASYDASAMSPDEQALQKARNDLSNAKLIYSDSNPKIVMLQSRVTELEKRVASASAGSGKSASANLGPRGLLDAQLADLDKQVQALQDQNTKLQAEKDQIDATLKEIPATSIAVDSLQRDYNNLQSQYTDANQRLADAATGERIELGAKGQRIEVVEQATVPSAPSKPDRLLISAGGLGAGVSLGLGVIVLLELLNRSIRRPVELTDKLSITPFAVLPYLQTDDERARKRRTVLLVLVAVVICIPVGLLLIQTFVISLDQVVEHMVNKLGFSLGF